jgi:hypothetical protein
MARYRFGLYRHQDKGLSGSANNGGFERCLGAGEERRARDRQGEMIFSSCPVRVEANWFVWAN